MDDPKFAGATTIEPTFFHALVSGQRRGWSSALARGGLWAACVPYGWATRFRNVLYDYGWKGSHRAGVPVVSVGNLTLGGTGKTPCVEYVARYYRDLGRRPAILSRGYGSHDEAPALAENLPDVPHLQGADRVCLARQAEVQGCDILVLDDGFQHRRLQRDLDVVLIDATQPWGHDYLFPRGLLREDVDGLGRAGVVLLTRCDLVTEAECRRLRDQILDHAGWVPIVETAHGPVEWINGSQTAALEGAIGETVAAFCGIGNPEAFRRTLTSLDMLVREFRSFPDHHRYSPADLDELNRWAARLPVDRIVTTQKDLVKLRCDSLGGKPLWALRVALRVRNGEPILHRALSNALEVRSRNHAVPLAKEGP